MIQNVHFFIIISLQENVILERRAAAQQAEMDEMLERLERMERMRKKTRVISEDQTKLLNQIFGESTSGKLHKI